MLLSSITIHLCVFRCLIKDNLRIHEEFAADRSIDEIEKHRSKLSECLKAHRQAQKQLMPAVYAHYIDQELKDDDDDEATILPEDVHLYLPSSFTAVQCNKFKIVPLGVAEGKLREAAAYDAIISIRNAVKDVTVAKHNNRAHGHSQATHTRYRKLIRDAERKQNNAVTAYHTLRTAMIALGVIQEEDNVFRPIQDKDLYRKDTSAKRNIGDTYRNDGRLQGMPIPDVSGMDIAGTQGTKCKRKWCFCCIAYILSIS